MRYDAAQSLTSAQKTQARSNLGLATVASSGSYADLSGKPTLGTAAALDVGTTALKVVQLDSGGKLPALDGSQLTGILGGSDTIVALSSAHTVATTENKNLFVCSPTSASMTLTVSAPSTYASTFQFGVVNSGTAGVLVALNGTNIWLYPGLSVFIWKNGTAWSTDLPVTAPFGSYTTRSIFGALAPGCAFSGGVAKVYVSQTSGSDDNDGLTSSTAFKTISRAWLALFNIHHQGTNPIIQLSVENYNTFLEPSNATYIFGCPPGTHCVYIQGDPTGVNSGNYQIRNGANNTIAVNVNDGSVIIWKGLELTAGGSFTGCTGILAARNVVCDFTLMIFGAFLTGGYALQMQNGAQCSLTGNCQIAVGPSANAFAYVGPGGWFNIGGSTYNCSAAMTFAQAFVYAFGSGANVQVDPGAVFSGVGAGTGSTGHTYFANYNAFCRNQSSSAAPGSTGALGTNGGQSI